ncbi:MFS transporter [Streptomyces tricolor]|uniref:MFS transporter n=1 Tax=Streptomyces tricolor TaxID=68277 RepID=A0ABS9J8A4_9ACTN|nr:MULTISPECIES: MFS transporter [Streptomyces]MCG0061800.1 MFS transporter [Streptomyces tricolor]OYP14721.1 MFS transporter [Streptomyces sp. FBKL.4005]
MTVVNSAPSADPAPSRGRRAGALTGISLGYFMVLLDTTVLSVAEPDLASSLGTSTAGLQWAVTGYTVVFAALLLSAGAAADRFGAERLFRCGVTVFALASLLSAAAPGLGVLLLLRAVSGAAAAACVPASMAMIARLYPEPAARARAIAVWAAISGAAVAAGPLAGGALVGAAGWRAVFLVNVPLALAVLALTRGRSVSCPRSGRRIDWPAQLAAVAVLALLTDALIAAGARSWIHAAWSSAGLLIAVPALYARERRSQAPVIDRALLRSARVRSGLLAAAAANFALAGALFVLPLLLQRERHLSALQTGLAFLPLTVPFAVNPPLTGKIVARTGPRPPILAGLALLVVGGTLLACTVFADGASRRLAPGLLLTGLGISCVLPALAAAVISAAPPGTAGAAGGLLNAVRQVGATLGVALMGAAAAAGTGWSLLLSAGVCALAGTAFARTHPAAAPR